MTLSEKKNRGEWSELYALTSILATGKIKTSETSKNVEGTEFPIVSVSRKINGINHIFRIAGLEVEVMNTSDNTPIDKVSRLELSRQSELLLSKIKALVMDGAVILGPAPKLSPSLQNQPLADQQVQAMATELWGEVDGVKVKSRKFGKGMVMNGINMTEAFALINCVPDCKLPQDNSIHYGHRTSANGEIYFVSNQTTQTKLITPEFRVKGMQPELWEATTGYMRDLPAYEQKGNTTAVPIKLEAYESVFVVFRKVAGKASTNDNKGNYPEPAVVVDLKGPWNVKFDDQQRGPEKAVVFETLQDWSTSKDDKIKYYSGTAIYSSKFNVSK